MVAMVTTRAQLRIAQADAAVVLWVWWGGAVVGPLSEAMTRVVGSTLRLGGDESLPNR